VTILEDIRALPLWGQARLRWRLERRPKQIQPAGDDWRWWVLMTGRGWGKTRTGAEWIVEQAQTHPGTRWAVVAPTFADARDTCIEGESGVLYCLGEDPPIWNRSIGEMTLANGSHIRCFSAEKPKRLRGPQHHGAWADELAAWDYPEAWDQLKYTVRLPLPDGTKPRVVVTTTPQPTRLVRGLVADHRTVLISGHTDENVANLSADAVEDLYDTYGGTRMGRQELAGELLLDTPGALWTLEMIDAARHHGPLPDFDRVVVGVDPAVTSGEDADRTGVVTVGRAGDRLWVLSDDSGRYTPDGTARVAIGALDRWGADRIVGEVNNGGDYIGTVIRHADGSVPYRSVSASRGKRVRAEPVAALYEQGRVHHCEGLGDLEDELCRWTPDAVGSPDRMDALVWAVAELTGRSKVRRQIKVRV
jgi:phage terminase large subunit-like protein